MTFRLTMTAELGLGKPLLFRQAVRSYLSRAQAAKRSFAGNPKTGKTACDNLKVPIDWLVT